MMKLSEIKTPLTVGNDLGKAEVLQILKEHCKDAAWMIRENRPLWRGWKNLKLNSAAVIDAQSGERVSKNTSNHYTVLLDHTMGKEYPRRSKSLISTTSITKAGFFSWGMNTVLIPYDGVRIGVIPGSDMWALEMDYFGYPLSPDQANNIYTALGIKPSIEDFKRYSNQLADAADNSELVKDFIRVHHNATGTDTMATKIYDRVRHAYFEALLEIYNAENLGLESANTADLLSKISDADDEEGKEVWVGGKCLVISGDIWHDIREAAIKTGVV